jgi:hypothetical protein
MAATVNPRIASTASMRVAGFWLLVEGDFM